MDSILLSVDVSESIHGLPWRRVFKIRNAVAHRWCDKFRDKIPVEEFLSEGNLVIAESVAAFTVQPGCTFAGFLYRALSRRMPSVPRRYWTGGTNTFSHDRPGRGRKLLSVKLQGPQLCPLPDEQRGPAGRPPLTPPALTAATTQEGAAYLRECFRYLDAHSTPSDRAYLAQSLEGKSSTEIALHSGVHKITVQRRLKATRAQVVSWAQEVSYAAADERS